MDCTLTHQVRLHWGYPQARDRAARWDDMPRQYARVHLGASGGMELDGMALHQVANPQCKRIAEVFRFTWPGKVSACLKCLHKGATHWGLPTIFVHRFDLTTVTTVMFAPSHKVPLMPSPGDLALYSGLSPVLGPKRLQYFVANILVTWRNTERPDMTQHDTIWHMAASKSLSASVSAPGPKVCQHKASCSKKG